MKSLVVEDDPTVRDFLVACLEMMDHDVQSCGSVAEALHTLRRQKFDLLLVDYMLTDGPSVPVMDYFGATCPNSRSILLTGTGVFPNGETSFFAPSVDWTLRKPVEMQDLQAVVEYAMRDCARGPITRRARS